MLIGFFKILSLPQFNNYALLTPYNVNGAVPNVAGWRPSKS